MGTTEAVLKSVREAILIKDHVERLERDVDRIFDKIDRLVESMSKIDHRVSRIDGWIDGVAASEAARSNRGGSDYPLLNDKRRQAGLE